MQDKLKENQLMTKRIRVYIIRDLEGEGLKNTLF